MARKRPKMPPRLRKLVYERNGFTCRECSDCNGRKGAKV